MGPHEYDEIIKELRRFDLGLELLIYGFDGKGRPHIFEVTNPGSVKDYDVQGYAVIGSGIDMAYASLNRKKLDLPIECTIYRCLEAKFASETARNVGAATYIVTLNKDGKYGMTKNVEEVRKIWRGLNEQPEPKDAIKIIKTMNAVTAISDREH